MASADALPGTPDFVFYEQKVAVFVHGCFWHGCPRCYRRPHSSQAYWDEKVARNPIRDRRVESQLRCSGWNVVCLWECQLTPAKAPRTIARIERALRLAPSKF